MKTIEINENTIKMFVDKLNRECYKRFDSTLENDDFYKKYGSLYDFKFAYYDDVPNNWLIYDDNGTFDWFEDTFCRKLIDELLKKNGWYGEPCHSYCDFCLEYL